MSPARKKLFILEQTGKYVFHGTGEDIDVLEPRQAHKFTEGPGGKGRKDGAPSVFASTSADFAVFFAILNPKNCPLGRHAEVASFSFKDGTYDLRFKASEATLSQLSADSFGYVYVFDKAAFVEREPGGLEYTNRNPVKPLEKIKVTKTDILGTITS